MLPVLKSQKEPEEQENKTCLPSLISNLTTVCKEGLFSVKARQKCGKKPRKDAHSYTSPDRV